MSLKNQKKTYLPSTVQELETGETFYYTLAKYKNLSAIKMNHLRKEFLSMLIISGGE